MRLTMVGVMGLGALLVSFSIVFFLWSPPTPRAPMAHSVAPPATVPASIAAPARPAIPAAAIAESTGSIKPAATPAVAARQPVASARPCQNPDALGISRTVEVDTTGGPGFGFEHFKQHDFLQPGEVVLTFDDGPWPHHTPAVLAALEDD